MSYIVYIPIAVLVYTLAYAYIHISVQKDKVHAAYEAMNLLIHERIYTLKTAIDNCANLQATPIDINIGALIAQINALQNLGIGGIDILVEHYDRLRDKALEIPNLQYKYEDAALSSLRTKYNEYACNYNRAQQYWPQRCYVNITEQYYVPLCAN